MGAGVLRWFHEAGRWPLSLFGSHLSCGFYISFSLLHPRSIRPGSTRSSQGRSSLRGAEFLKGYPNTLAHVAVFRFKESSRGKKVWDINESFEAPPDYVIIELESGSTFYCRAESENDTFVFRGENCYRTLDKTLTRRITLTGCLNATYNGYHLERNAILIFEFRAANRTTCVNETVEVRGRLYDVLMRIETENGTVEFPLKRVEGNYLTDEVFMIGDQHK